MPYDNPYDREFPDVMEAREFPDWKNRKNCSTKPYESKRILGKMWNLMNDKIKDTNRSIKVASVVPENVNRVLNDCDNLTVLEEQRELLRGEVEVYMGMREEKKEMTPTELYDWMDQYCADRRRALMTGKAFEVIGNMEKSAILYEQCRKIDSSDCRNRATEFAWLVAPDELLKLLPGDISLCVGKMQEKILYG